jgi:hypothetical protein
MVKPSARGRARAGAQGRGDDGAGSEESIGNRPSVGTDEVAGRGFWFYRPTFFGEVSEERRPWAIKRERSPGRVCPAFQIDVFIDQSKRSGVRVRSMSAALHTGMRDLARFCIEARAASLGTERRRRDGDLGGSATGALRAMAHSSTCR